MIKVIVQAGIGNQLFKYAAGRALACRHESPLYFDVSAYGIHYKRRYVLPRFPTAGKTINPISSIIFKIVFKQPLWKLSRSPIYYEKDHHFDESVLSLPKSCTLLGSFQSEKYFKCLSNIIRDDLSFKDFPMDNATQDLEKEILNSNSVSIHVRRGKEYQYIRRYKVCTMKYYRKAMDLIRKEVDNPYFYVFSDDIRWCSYHFRDPQCFFVDLEQSREDPLNDMRLMSLCKHNIIANSSFSWWGAWLNSNPQKMVICPYIWFNAEDVPIEDKMCVNWLKVVF
ncbi:MAG: alpha-1,2-fucosyltransferase [Thermodesulfobacteriota bacterium]|nr:alpha-1,2-fucosyltransferase [Thermodesulfobacteriota bacterium]